jgi:hypothetical protein
MTKRTRLFLLVAAGVLVVGLGTGLIASYMGMGLSTLAVGRSDGPDELHYLPADAKVVAYANVRDVMSSELRQKVRQLRPDSAHHDDFENQTGIDVERDVDIVVASLSAAPNDDEHDENGLILARGRFDQVRIEGLMLTHGGQVTTYNGKRLLTRESANDHAVSLAFIEPGLVAFGSAAAVRGAIDRKRGGQNITDNDEVMGLVRDIDDGNAWAVGRFEALANRARLPREVANQLPPINWFAASGHINGGIRGTIRAEARDETAAQNLRDVVRGFMALAKLQSNANPELTTMMNSLQLRGDGKTVSLDFSLPSEVIDVLGAIGRQHRRGHDNRDPDLDVDPDPDVDRPEPPRPPAPPHPPRPPRPPGF